MAVHEGVAHSYGEAGGNKYASSAQRPSAPTIHHVIMPGRGGGVHQWRGGSVSGGRGPPRRPVHDTIRPFRLAVALGLKIHSDSYGPLRFQQGRLNTGT